MTIEKLTKEECRILEAGYATERKAIGVIDAQTADLAVERSEHEKWWERARALEAQLAKARALLDRCNMVPYSLLDDIRKWQRANPESPRAADMTDAQHQEVFDTMLKPGLSAESRLGVAERAVLELVEEWADAYDAEDLFATASIQGKLFMAVLARRAVKHGG